MDALCPTDGILMFVIEHCVCNRAGIWEISILGAEFCCEYKTTLRNKAYC